MECSRVSPDQWSQYSMSYLVMARGHRHLSENTDLRLRVQSPPYQQFFKPLVAKNQNKAPSGRVIVICNDHRLLWRDSYKGVDRALTRDDSILHKIITVIILGENKPPCLLIVRLPIRQC